MAKKTHTRAQNIENFDKAIAGALTILQKIQREMPCSDGTKKGQAKYPKYWTSRRFQSQLVDMRMRIWDLEKLEG